MKAPDTRPERPNTPCICEDFIGPYGYGNCTKNMTCFVRDDSKCLDISNTTYIGRSYSHDACIKGTFFYGAHFMTQLSLPI